MVKLEDNVEDIIKNYSFLNYINEDKSHYKTATEAGYDDPDNLFLIGDSGGFQLNIQPGDKFVNTHLFTEMADFYRKNKKYTFYKISGAHFLNIYKTKILVVTMLFAFPTLTRREI